MTALPRQRRMMIERVASRVCCLIGQVDQVVDDEEEGSHRQENDHSVRKADLSGQE
jgi:hypothetical protein